MSTDTYVDPVAVERLVRGDINWRDIRPAERVQAVRRLNARGLCDSDIADDTGMTKKQVCGIRRRHGIAAVPDAAYRNIARRATRRAS